MLSISSSFASNDGIGKWEGKILFSPTSMADVEVNLSRSMEQKLTGTISVAGQQGVPKTLENLKVDGSSVSFDINDGRTKASFNGLLAGDGSSIKGKFSQAGQLFPFELNREKGDLSTHPSITTTRE
jgi:hypothetical protein